MDGQIHLDVLELDTVLLAIGVDGFVAGDLEELAQLTTLPVGGFDGPLALAARVLDVLLDKDGHELARFAGWRPVGECHFSEFSVT